MEVGLTGTSDSLKSIAGARRESSRGSGRRYHGYGECHKQTSVVLSVWRTHTVDFTGVLARNPFGNRANRGKGKLTHPCPGLRTHANQVIRRIVNDKRVKQAEREDRSRVSDPVS